MDVGNNNNEEAVGEENYDPDMEYPHEDAGGSIEHGDGFGFTEFDLEIDVDGQDAIDIDYDVSSNAEASFENKLKNLDLEGADAMDALNQMFVHILITKDMTEDVVTEKVLEHLEIDDYTKFDLDVHFDDGTILDINKTK